MTTALGLRAGSPSITPFSFPIQECLVRLPVWAIDAKSASGRSVGLHENRDIDDLSRLLTLALKGKRIIDLARGPADRRGFSLIAVRNVAFLQGAFVYLS
jgi:hypothetical protein